MAADGASGIGVAGRHRGTKIKSVSPLRGERESVDRARSQDFELQPAMLQDKYMRLL